MNKKDWKDGLKRLQDIMDVAVKNLKTSQDQIEETKLMIQAYVQKIKTFK